MTKKLFTLISLTLMFLTGNAQVTLNDFQDASIYFNGIFENDSKLDEYGNVCIDMGSASAGRLSFRITDVNITMEEKKEEPGCADICPPRIIITFNCRKSKCMTDPTLNNYVFQSGIIEFIDLKKGKKAFQYLQSLKKFIQKK